MREFDDGQRAYLVRRVALPMHDLAYALHQLAHDELALDAEERRRGLDRAAALVETIVVEIGDATGYTLQE